MVRQAIRIDTPHIDLYIGWPLSHEIILPYTIGVLLKGVFNTTIETKQIEGTLGEKMGETTRGITSPIQISMLYVVTAPGVSAPVLEDNMLARPGLVICTRPRLWSQSL